MGALGTVATAEQDDVGHASVVADVNLVVLVDVGSCCVEAFDTLAGRCRFGRR